MKATVLSDNIPAENLGCEWGLSIFIEYHGKHILLDAGASGLFLKNADVLGLNMKDVDFGVLSHAHYDHASIKVPLPVFAPKWEWWMVMGL